MSSTATAAPAASKAAPPPVGTQLVLMSDIQPDPRNRKDHDKAKLQKLAEQIKAEGLLQPIVIRPLFLGGLAKKYQIVAGERRFLAHQILKAEKIEAKIVDVQGDELSAVVKQTVENMAREDLNPIDRARQMRRLSELKMPQAEVGKLFGGLSQPTVANTMKLLDLPAEVQQLVLAGKIEAATAQELVRFARWRKACVLMAQTVAKENENAEYDDERWSAKRIREDLLPLSQLLVERGLAVAIYTGSYEYGNRKRYVVPASFNEEQGFFIEREGYSSEAFYLLPDDPKAPNLWEPERAKQDKAREEAAKKKATAEGKAQAKLSPAEKAKRLKTIAENKQYRAESALADKAVLERIKAITELDGAMLTVVAAAAFSLHYSCDKHIADMARLLGIKAPGGSELDQLAKLKPVDAVRLAAACICRYNSGCAMSAPAPIPDDIAHILGPKATAALKAKAKAEISTPATKKGGRK